RHRESRHPRDSGDGLRPDDSTGPAARAPSQLPHGAQRSRENTDPWDEVDRLAGILGIDPDPLTWRQLLQRASGRLRHEARMLAALRASIANGPLKKKVGGLWTLDDFDAQSPGKQRTGMPLDKKGLAL